MKPTILIAGIGNIFFGDDAFGSEVSRRLAARLTATNIRVVDFGIRGLDLVYALMDGYDATIVVDATPRGGDPGTIYVIEPDLNQLNETDVAVDPHSMDPMRVLAVARSMGAELKNIQIVGCEPEHTGTAEEGHMGLSPKVADAVERAIGIIEELTEEFALNGGTK